MAGKTNDGPPGSGASGRRPDSGGDTLRRPKPKFSISTWVKENPNVAKVGLLGVLGVILVVVLWANFGGDGKDEKKRGKGTTQARDPQSQRRPQPPEKQPPEAKPPENGEKSKPPDETPKAPEKDTKPEEKPQRPDDVSQWEAQDYYDARQEGDPRLIDAVGCLAERAPGSIHAARNLAKLLEPLEVEQQAGTKPPRGGRVRPRRQDPKLIEAIVAALDANGSHAARSILERLLAGTVPTEDDKTAVEAALKTLAGHPCPENDAILFRALTAAEKLRPPGQGEVTAEQLRQNTLALIEPVASEQFRIELAKYLINPTTPRTRREVLGKFIEERHPDNLGAQFVLYQSDETPKETKATLAGYFIAYSSKAMGEMLGISDEEVGTSRRPSPRRFSSRSTGHADPKQADPDLPYRLARKLWSAECLAMIEKQLGPVDSLDEQPQFLVLAGTMPVDSMRSAVWKTLKKHWEDGSETLRTAGLSEGVITDPGLLLAIKNLPRKDPKDPKDSKSRTSGKSTGSSGTTAAARRAQAAEDWMSTSKELVQAWCQRFHVAALAQAEAARLEGRDPDVDKVADSLTVARHKNAKVTAAYHLNWPGDTLAKLSGVTPGPMEIGYVRIEEKNRPRSVMGHYQRQLNLTSRAVRRIEKGGWWLDRRRVVPEKASEKAGWKRSVDVLITPAEEDPDRKPGEVEDLVIEILSIEMKDPEKS